MSESRQGDPSPRARLFARLEELKGIARTGLLKVDAVHRRLKEKTGSHYPEIRTEVHELHTASRVRGRNEADMSWTLALVELGIPPEGIEEIWDKKTEHIKTFPLEGQENSGE